MRALDAADLRVADLQLHQPSLDDVFLAKTGRKLDAGDATTSPRRSRSDGCSQQAYEMARRSILQTLRQPAMVIPPILFPLILMGINVGGLDAATNIPGFPPVDSYLDFAIAFPFIQGSLFASINAGSAVARDIETGFLNRLALTPMQRAALLLGNLSRRDGRGADLVADLSGGRLRRRAALRGGLRAACSCCSCWRMLIALAFASIGRVHRAAHRLRRGGPGRLPAVLRLPVPVVELAAAQRDRAGLVPDRSPPTTRSPTCSRACAR